MPTHDLECRICGAVQEDVYCPLYTLPEPRRQDGYVVKQDIRLPEHCGEPMGILPPLCVVDAKEPGAAFEVEVKQPDGSFRTERVDSLRKMRQIERTSEAAARNGEGQQMVWRDYSQDRSNGDRNVFGEPTQVKPSPEAAAKFGRRSKAFRASQAEPTHAFGPGVNESNTSALRSTL